MTTFSQWVPGETIVLMTVECLLAVTIVACFALGLDRALARRDAGLSRNLWLAAVLAIFLTPVIVIFGPKIPLPIHLLNVSSRLAYTPRQLTELEPPASTVVTRLAQPESLSKLVFEDSASQEAPEPPRPRPLAVSATWSPSKLAAYLLCAWALGAVIRVLRLLHGLGRIGRVIAKARRLTGPEWSGMFQSVAQDLRLSRIPEVRLSTSVRCPVVAGLMRPCTLLPEALIKSATSAELQDVILHEWAHIAQLDPWIRIVEQLNASLFWFHPLVHLVNHRLALACEDTCDNQVLAHRDPPAYAETLLKVATFCYPEPIATGYITMIPRRCNLEHRIAGFLNPQRQHWRKLKARHRLFIFTSLLLLFISMATLSLRGSATASDGATGTQSTAMTERQHSAAREGKIEGRFTAVDTGKAVAGVNIRVLIQGKPGRSAIVETMSDADGRYTLTVPFGACRLWGVAGPAGYYTQDPKTKEFLAVSQQSPVLVRNFALRNGSAWRLERPDRVRSAETFFSAFPDAASSVGDVIQAFGDPKGKAVLTIPTAGGSYRFYCGLQPNSGYEIPSVSMNIDSDFDPCQLQGQPTWQIADQAFRLRDMAGRTAVIHNANVVADRGQAVIRFLARPIPKNLAFVLRGAAVDAAGKPITGATATAAFAGKDSSAMTSLNAVTDDRGRFELRDLRVPESNFDGYHNVRMYVTKPGYDGAETKELTLPEVAKTRIGDFGTVVLNPGHVLRGKVVDDKGRPLQGAAVTNLTNYFLYNQLTCRTDAQGRFTMPDLSFGYQNLSANYGPLDGLEDFNFKEDSGECVITVRPTPKTGMTAEPDSKMKR